MTTLVQFTRTEPRSESPRRRAKVVLTVNACWNVWNFRRPVVQWLLDEGFAVTVLAPFDDTCASLAAMGCKVVDIAMDNKGINPGTDALFLWRMRNALRRIKPDIVLGYTVKNNIYGAIAARSLGIPFVPNVTGLGTAFLSGALIRGISEYLYKVAFSELPIVFFQNDDDQELFVSRKIITPTRAVVLPGSGVDLDYFGLVPFPSREDGPAFLMIARLLRDKGVYEYAQAAGMVKARYPHVRFQLLGPTGVENRSAIDLETVRSWETRYGIEYLGVSSDVRPQIAEAACVVLPSYREGAPRTLIEAAAMGRPVIASDVPGCRAVLDDGRTGFLCQAKDADSLAAACTKFLALDNAGQAAMGRAGRAKMEREFDEVLVVRAYRDAIARFSHAQDRH